MKTIKRNIFVKRIIVGAVITALYVPLTIANAAATTQTVQTASESSFGIVDEVYSITGEAITNVGVKMPVSLTLDITEPRDLLILVQDKINFKTSDTQVYSLGQSGNVDIEVNIDENLIDGNYRFVAMIVPIGGTWRDRLSPKINWQFAVDSSFGLPIDSIDNFVFPEQIQSNTIANLSLDLTTSNPVDIHVNLLDAAGDEVVHSASTQTVSGQAIFDIDVPNVNAGQYTWQAFITPVGGTEADVIGDSYYQGVEIQASSVGDLDHDNDVDSNDLKEFLSMIRNREQIPLSYDFNNDGRVNQRDLSGFRQLCTLSRCAVVDNPIPRIMEIADFDHDGDVDRYDRSELFKQIVNQSAGLEHDMNEDGSVDRCDVVFIKNACKTDLCN